jgi:hypothetical protein
MDNYNGYKHGNMKHSNTYNKNYNNLNNHNNHNNNNHNHNYRKNIKFSTINEEQYESDGDYNNSDNHTDSYRNNYTKTDNTNINIKNILLDYLYNKIEVNDHKYSIIKNIGDVYEIKNNKYYVSANSCGINSLLIFLKHDDEYYSYMIDRRSISYNKNTLKKNMVRFTEIKISVDLKLYDGTIMDGILIDNDNTNIIQKGDNKTNKMMFMITDVFTLCSKSMLAMNYKKKMY